MIPVLGSIWLYTGPVDFVAVVFAVVVSTAVEDADAARGGGAIGVSGVIVATGAAFGGPAASSADPCVGAKDGRFTGRKLLGVSTGALSVDGVCGVFTGGAAG